MWNDGRDHRIRFEPSSNRVLADCDSQIACGISIRDAARDGRVDEVRQLIASGSSADEMPVASCGRGESPLHLAAENGHSGVVHILLEAGARKDAKRTNGDTPLHRAAINGHDCVARLLLQAGSNKDVTNSHGDTPLHDASSCGR